nr:translation initiation factor IF-2-like [Caretta caretta]
MADTTQQDVREHAYGQNSEHTPSAQGSQAEGQQEAGSSPARQETVLALRCCPAFRLPAFPPRSWQQGGSRHCARVQQERGTVGSNVPRSPPHQRLGVSCPVPLKPPPRAAVIPGRVQRRERRGLARGPALLGCTCPAASTSSQLGPEGARGVGQPGPAAGGGRLVPRLAAASGLFPLPVPGQGGPGGIQAALFPLGVWGSSPPPHRVPGRAERTFSWRWVVSQACHAADGRRLCHEREEKAGAEKMQP